MILLDTTIWVDHLRNSDPTVVSMLQAQAIVMHSAVLGEILLGNFRDRRAVFSALKEVPRIQGATDDDVIRLLDLHQLFGSGVGFVDAHLVAACLLTGKTYLWTRDRRLEAVASRLGISANA